MRVAICWDVDVPTLPNLFIKLTIKNKFQPEEKNDAYVGGNVFGGCYKTGTVRGDVTIDLRSDMLAGKDKKKLENSNDSLWLPNRNTPASTSMVPDMV